MLVILALISLAAGILIGTVGIGGVLIIPAMSWLAQLTTRVSMATALFSFIFTGAVGTYLYQSKGSIDWRITIPICAGAVSFGYTGAVANSLTDTSTLNLILAVLIVFAGIYTLRPWRGHRELVYKSGNRLHLIMLLLIGATVGFASGLTGVGGPLLSVPLMVIIGFAPLTAIATSQVIQIAASASGTAGNIVHGTIDFGIASWVTLIELAGVIIGVRIAHSVNSHLLRKLVAIVCLIIGGLMIIHRSGLYWG